MNTNELRRALQSNPRLALIWAKRFRFCEDKHHHEYPEYDERAYLAYQAILWAANKDLRLIMDWLPEMWVRTVIGIEGRSTFGTNSNIEYDNLGEFIEHLMKKAIEERPKLLRDWMMKNANQGGRYNSVEIDWLESLFAKKPADAFKAIRDLLDLHRDRQFHHERGHLDFVITSALKSFLLSKPDVVMKFLDRHAISSPGLGQIMDEVLGTR